MCVSWGCMPWCSYRVGGQLSSFQEFLLISPPPVLFPRIKCRSPGLQATHGRAVWSPHSTFSFWVVPQQFNTHTQRPDVQLCCLAFPTGNYHHPGPSLRTLGLLNGCAPAWMVNSDFLKREMEHAHSPVQSTFRPAAAVQGQSHPSHFLPDVEINK